MITMENLLCAVCEDDNPHKILRRPFKVYDDMRQKSGLCYATNGRIAFRIGFTGQGPEAVIAKPGDEFSSLANRIDGFIREGVGKVKRYDAETTVFIGDFDEEISRIDDAAIRCMSNKREIERSYWLEDQGSLCFDMRRNSIVKYKGSFFNAYYIHLIWLAWMMEPGLMRTNVKMSIARDSSIMWIECPFVDVVLMGLRDVDENYLIDRELVEVN